jgi:hypothetical protein
LRVRLGRQSSALSRVRSHFSLVGTVTGMAGLRDRVSRER